MATHLLHICKPRGGLVRKEHNQVRALSLSLCIRGSIRGRKGQGREGRQCRLDKGQLGHLPLSSPPYLSLLPLWYGEVLCPVI